MKQLAKGQVLEEDIRLFISPRAEAKTYNVVVNLEYRDKNGNHYTTSEVIGVKVYKNGKTFYTDSDPLLIINGRSLNYSPVTLGKSFDITLDLFNATNTTAKNITITFVEDGTDQLRTFSPSAGSNVLFLPELKGEQTTSVTMALDISKEIPTQIYNLNVKIEYENFEGEKFDSMATVGIPVKGNDNKTIGPELTISSYELSSPLIEIGSTFDISLNVKNIGDESASNVKISLSSPENGNQVVLTPFGNSNTIVAEKVSSGEIVNRNIKYLISTEGKSRIYTVNVSMSYVDEEGQQRTTHETISIPVESPRDIKITSLNFPKHVNIDEKFGLGLEFINIGKEPIDNLQVSFEGDFNVDEPYYYINKFEPGNTEYFESVALVDSPGTYRGAIYLKYKDGYDQEKIISKPIEIQVSDPTAAEINEMEAEEPKGFWSKVLGFILAIFGLG
ncbi:COG1361 S-layer family protein [Caldalkalibacillus mannanilyticus]|uniref:COG1361 S-layer family protein n=1 Tax=Caldalkalibacillus mannanilyticus TaxID=1418 RepID=UPI0004687F85|nr:CARDB domain-containing protein [Caldalkalibacillus mannanilyticus]